MKKWLIGLLAVVLVLTAAGCGAGNESAGTAKEVTLEKVFTAGYESGTKYLFTFGDSIYHLSLKEASGECWLSAPVTDELTQSDGSTVSAIQETFLTGTYTSGEAAGTVHCTFTAMFSRIQVGKNFSRAEYKAMLSRALHEGDITQEEYDAVYAMVIEGKTVSIDKGGESAQLLAQLGTDGTFLPGKLTWYENGQVDSVEEYDGETAREHFYYNGTLTQTTEYDSAGAVLRIWYYSDEGILEEEMVFYPNGTTQTRISYNEAGQPEEIVEFYENKNWKNAKYYTRGVLTQEVGYDTDGKELFLTEYNNGKMSRQEQYENGQTVVCVYDSKERLIERHWLNEEGLCRKIEVSFPNHYKTYTYEAVMANTGLGTIYHDTGSGVLKTCGAIFEFIPNEDINARKEFLIMEFGSTGDLTARNFLTPAGIFSKSWAARFVYDEKRGKDICIGSFEQLYDAYGNCGSITVYDADDNLLFSRQRENSGYYLCYEDWKAGTGSTADTPVFQERLYTDDGRYTKVYCYDVSGKLLFSRECDADRGLRIGQWVQIGDSFPVIVAESDSSGVEKAHHYYFDYVLTYTKHLDADLNCVRWTQYAPDGHAMFEAQAIEGYEIADVDIIEETTFVTSRSQELNSSYVICYGAMGKPTHCYYLDTYYYGSPDRNIVRWQQYNAQGVMYIDHAISNSAVGLNFEYFSKSGQQYMRISEYDSAGNTVYETEYRLQ